MDRKFEAEIREFHDALTDWFTGKSPRSAAGYSGLSDVVPADFVLISPSGVVTEGPSLMAQMEGAHGVHSGIPFSIRIENCRLRVAAAPYCLGTYEEWQERDGVTTARLATALFRTNAGLRHGLEWLHLHETWLDGHAPEG
jgi:hypothetical protein